jgi:hypothetical protein
MARTMDRVSYGEPLTTGRGMTLKPREDTLNALIGAAPFAQGAKAAAPLARKGAAMAMQNALAPSDMAMQGQRGALAPEALGEWLSGTKIADKSGKPLVVYHGTNKEFDGFSPAMRGTKTGNPNAQLGHFFTDSPAEASRYAADWGKEGGQVIPAYLAIKQPYEMPYKEFDDLAMASWRGLMSDPTYDPKAVVKFGDMAAQKASAARMTKHEEAAKAAALKRRDELISEGYDGVVAKVGGVREYVAFHPEQIKSAISGKSLAEQLAEKLK